MHRLEKVVSHLEGTQHKESALAIRGVSGEGCVTLQIMRFLRVGWVSDEYAEQEQQMEKFLKSPRFKNISRPYGAKDVVKFQSPIPRELSCRHTSQWRAYALHTGSYVGAVTARKLWEVSALVDASEFLHSA